MKKKKTNFNKIETVEIVSNFIQIKQIVRKHNLF